MGVSCERNENKNQLQFEILKNKSEKSEKIFKFRSVSCERNENEPQLEILKKKVEKSEKIFKIRCALTTTEMSFECLM